MSSERAVLEGVHLLTGNIAVAEGAIAAGCSFFAGYPITPQNEILERMAERMPKLGRVFVQMEDEIASIASVIGASLAGARAMTATSGPGFSLMQESISWAAMIEVPIVIVNVQRTSPASGIVSLPHHGDVMQSRFGGNGDYEVIALAPWNCQECFDLTIDAFRLAEQWRVPVIVLTDAFIGHLSEKVIIPSQDEISARIPPRPRSSLDPRKYIPLSYEKAGQIIIPEPMQLGTEYFPWWLPSVCRNERAIPTLLPEGAFKNVSTLCWKLTRNADRIAMMESHFLDDSEIIVIAYGIEARAGLEAVRMARQRGIPAGLLRLKTIWPFPESSIRKAIQGAKAIIVPEINMGQLFIEIDRAASKEGIPAHLLPTISRMHTPQEILSQIESLAG